MSLTDIPDMFGTIHDEYAARGFETELDLRGCVLKITTGEGLLYTYVVTISWDRDGTRVTVEPGEDGRRLCDLEEISLITEINEWMSRGSVVMTRDRWILFRDRVPSGSSALDVMMSVNHGIMVMERMTRYYNRKGCLHNGSSYFDVPYCKLH